MAEQPSTPPPTYVEKNPTEMPSAPEPSVAQPMTMHMPIQQPAGIPVASSSAHPIIIYTRDSGTSIYPNYNARYARAFGICQIIAGALALAFQIAAIIVGSTLGPVSAGIWVGVMFIVAGGLAIGSAAQKSKCLVIATLVMSIVSASFVTIIWSMSSISMATESDYYYDYDYDEEIKPRYAMDSMLLIIATAELVFAIIQSVLCCKVCCCGNGHNAVVYSATPAVPINQPATATQMNQNGPPMMVVNQNGPPMMAVNQTGQPMMAVNQHGQQIMIAPQYAHPQTQMYVQAPVQGVQTQAPIQGTQIQPPIQGTQIQAPIQGTQIQAPTQVTPMPPVTY